VKAGVTLGGYGVMPSAIQNTVLFSGAQKFADFNTLCTVLDRVTLYFKDVSVELRRSRVTQFESVAEQLTGVFVAGSTKRTVHDAPHGSTRQIACGAL
jgi:hypothetical protein